MGDLPALVYTRPATLRGALAALRRKGACIYAGGTDLLVALHHRDPAMDWIRELVDIKGLREAKGIELVGSELRIGALVTAAELIRSPLVRRHAPLLRDAALVTSAPMLRARGTIGGNIVTPHPSGDVATALLALGAAVDLASPTGTRRSISMQRAVSSKPGGVILAVRVPVQLPGAYEKVAHRRSFARAIVSVALVRHPRFLQVAIGGVDRRPVRIRVPRSVPGDAAALVSLVGNAVVSLQRADDDHRRMVLALVARAAQRLA